MKRHPAFGLLMGEAANINDSGAMFKSLDADGVPIFGKGQDTARGIYEIQQLRKQSGVAHVTVFRQSGIHDYDYPDYSSTPKEAAKKHWQLTKGRIPPELKPEWTWVETINEVAKWFEYGNESQINWPRFEGQPYQRKFWEGKDEQGNRKVYLDNANWLGWFAVEISHLMRAEGYKHLAFSWNTGEPEKWQWETDGILAYLRLCEQHHEELGVGIHEYSGVTDGLLMRKTARGGRERVKLSDVEEQNIVGRFQNTLVATCTKHNIAIPKFCVTEGGWGHARVNADHGIEHLKEAGEIYFQYEQCLGFALWGSVPGYEGIANQLQRLFALQNGSPSRLTNYLLNTQYEVKYQHGGEQPEPTPTPTPEPTPEPEPPTPIDPVEGDHYTFKSVKPSIDLTNAPANKPFSITWTVQNSGTTTWNDSYHFGYAGVTVPETEGLPSGAMSQYRWLSLSQASSKQSVAPGETVELTQTFKTPGWAATHASHWRLHNQENKAFGATFWVRLTVCD